MELLDVVAPLENFPEGNVMRGQVGTIVEKLDANNVLVEFADMEGIAYAISPIAVVMLLKLKHSPL